MLKNKLYQYFILSFFKNFCLIIISLSTLMLLTQAARFLSLITEQGNSTLVYINFVILNYPRIMEKTIILSFLISIFFTISKLQNDQELNIYWYSGVSKFNIVKLILLISFVIFIFNLLLSIGIGPYFANKSRQIIASSDFTFINSLVREKNFNTPLKNLTVYVDSNDQKGNLKKIFIHENDRTIVAKEGRVIKKNNAIFLELNDGNSLEKIDDKINAINFEELIFDFSKFKPKNLTYPKFSERSFFWLLYNVNNSEFRKDEIRHEINARIIKPFFIFLLAIFSSFILYAKEDKNKYNTRKFIFFISFILIVLNEVFLNFSSKNLLTSLSYFLLIFILSAVFITKHYSKLKNE